MIKGILFDFDNTLVDFSGAEKEIEDILFKKIEEQYKEYKVNVELLKRLFKTIRQKHRVLNSRPTDNSREIWFREMFDILGINGNAEIWEKEYWDLMKSHMKPFTYAKEIIEYAKNKGLKVAIITDSDGKPEIKDERIKKLGFDKIVDFVLKSDEIGFNKPCKKMFETALEKMQLRAEEVIIVGDDPPLDLKVPHEMGMKTVWKRVKNVPVPEYADYIIDDLKELEKIIDENI